MDPDLEFFYSNWTFLNIRTDLYTLNYWQSTAAPHRGCQTALLLLLLLLLLLPLMLLLFSMFLSSLPPMPLWPYTLWATDIDCYPTKRVSGKIEASITTLSLLFWKCVLKENSSLNTLKSKRSSVKASSKWKDLIWLFFNGKSVLDLKSRTERG